jgi:hypothetical protein
MATKKKTTTKKRFKSYCETTAEKTKQKPTEEPKLHAVKMKLEYTVLVYGTKDEINEIAKEELGETQDCGVLIPNFYEIYGDVNVAIHNSKVESIKEIKTIKDLESRADLANYEDGSYVFFCTSGSVKWENEESAHDLYDGNDLSTVIRVEKMC